MTLIPQDKKRRIGLGVSLFLHLMLLTVVLWGAIHPFRKINRTVVVKTSLVQPPDPREQPQTRQPQTPQAQPPKKPQGKTAIPPPKSAVPPKTAMAPAAKPRPNTSNIRDRINKGSSITVPKEKPQPQKPKESLEDRLRKTLDPVNPGSQKPIQPSSPEPRMTAAQKQTAARYSEEVVNPYIQQNWIPPSSGDYDVSHVQPVTISFTVYANGSVTDIRIETPSNSRILNQSVENFIRNLTALPPLSVIQSNQQYLRIFVKMGVTR